jgi:hypothetical protein
MGVKMLTAIFVVQARLATTKNCFPKSDCAGVIFRYADTNNGKVGR